MILVIHAHPYPAHSRACKALLAAVRDISNLSVRSLYDLYPDFDIDAAAEQAALAEAERIVWLHPIYWYSPPALLKHWFEKVLVHGWAYGPEGNALKGKRVLWAPTTGGDETAYSAEGMHEHPFDAFMKPVEETVRYCGMQWETPFAVHGAHLVSSEVLEDRAKAFAARLKAWAGDTHGVAAPGTSTAQSPAMPSPPLAASPA